MNVRVGGVELSSKKIVTDIIVLVVNWVLF